MSQLAQGVAADAVLQRSHLLRHGAERDPKRYRVVAGEAAVRRVLVPGEVLPVAARRGRRRCRADAAAGAAIAVANGFPPLVRAVSE